MIPTRSEIELLARQAGAILRHGYGRRHEVNKKGVIDLVTEVDHQSEAFLIGEIKRRYPDHRILAEESGGQTGDQCCKWYIDPLDGTVNYAHAVPFFAVSLALEVEGELQLGVVYDPMRDECFSAEAGRGAWLNGNPIHVSATEDLLNSLLVTGFPYDIRENPDNNLDHYNRLWLRTQGVSRLGSATLDISYVACGRLDGFWELRLGAWDVAAALLIAREAGALVSDIHGGPDYFPVVKSILVANPVLHPQISAVLSGRDG